MNDMKERMHTGELYFPDGEEITKEQRVYQDLLYEFNQTKPSEGEKRTELRQKGLQYNMPVHIGTNCWIGAGAIIMPGVTIGDHAVIGAGSVVTKDIPSNVVAVGNPCRIMREVSEHDWKYYFRNKTINHNEWKD